ncbi:MAG: hypothetical protein ACT4UQ_01310 [Gammaproteobacteria bacterium]
MKTKLHGAILLQAGICLLAANAAFAQGAPRESYTYATYHVCDLNQQDRADEIFGQLNKPILDAAVADGTITAYGFNAHNTGGRWRRVQYYMAPSIEALLDAGKKFGDQAEAKNKKLSDEFSKICNAHDDYIWHRVAGSIGTTSPGAATFSTYFVCESTREGEADALVKQVFAPIYDKLVADGKLKNWGWLEHIVGSQYRRLAVMGAADMKSLMAARAAVVQALEDNPLGDTFTEICDSHADYMWEVRYSNP